MNRKIATITLNPAIDESIKINDFTIDKVNRVKDIIRHPGGKGINVARFLSDYFENVTVTGFLGRDNIKIFQDYFLEYGIRNEFISITGETRTGLKILDNIYNTVTEINYPGIKPETDEIETLLKKVEVISKEYDLIIISGSIPGGVDPQIYGDIINIINKAGKKVIADTSGDAFDSATKAAPFMIKPNIHELEEFFSKKLDDDRSIINCCNHFLDLGIELIVVSMGAEGALFITKYESIKVIPPKTEVVSSVGAGDAMVSGTAYGLLTGHNLEETAKIATAFSLHAVTHLEMGIREMDFIENVIDYITVENIVI